MCGIAGYVNLDPDAPVDLPLLQKMTETLTHRGPDEDGFLAEGPAALGMRRLRIIDLEGGKQPISNEDKTVWVVFNGEIYNFLELRQELEGRHRFSTRTDTEVIVHLYEDRGPACVEALRGMFAFALWDSRERRLLLARDHMGKKPLYYSRTAHALWFGSEIKTLLASPAVGRTLDLPALDDYLALGYIPAPRSIFQEIRKLPQGSLLELKDGRERIHRFWRVDWSVRGSEKGQAAADGLLHQLEDSVKRRMIADVPLGAFLSGGIDSTTVVWLMSRMTSEPVKTFSIGFDHEQYNEIPYAREVSRAFKTEHHDEVVRPDALAILPELVKFFDEPFGDSSAIPTYLVSRLARRHVTVALSGDGGDEAFAGYNRYRKAYLMNRIRPLLLGKTGAHAAARLAGLLPIGASRARRISSALRRAALPAMERYFTTVGLYTPELRAELRSNSANPPPCSSLPEAFQAAWSDAISLDPVRRYQAVDIETYLPDDILVKVDRASMAVSLETRAPLLDYRLVQYSASLPGHHNFHGYRGKRLLRSLIDGKVPPAVLNRPKRGFSMPLALWFRQDWQKTARDLLLHEGVLQYFNRNAIEGMLTEHVGGWIDHSEHLWLLLVFSAWHDRYVGAS